MCACDQACIGHEVFDDSAASQKHVLNHTCGGVFRLSDDAIQHRAKFLLKSQFNNITFE